jgi:hypothetical protein
VQSAVFAAAADVRTKGQTLMRARAFVPRPDRLEGERSYPFGFYLDGLAARLPSRSNEILALIRNSTILSFSTFASNSLI